MRTLKAKDLKEMNAIRWWHRIAVGVGENGATVYTPGEVRHGPDGGSWPRTRFGIPDDLTGKTVLDVGAWDGFFSFYCEERGAIVTAMDVKEEQGGHWGGATTGFDFAKKMRGSTVAFTEGDIQDRWFFEKRRAATPLDLVLCYGVLYHIDNPFAAIDNLFSFTNAGGTCIIETAVETDSRFADVECWNRHAGFANDPTNKWYPSRKGLKATCEQAGFTDYEVVADIGERVTVRMKRS